MSVRVGTLHTTQVQPGLYKRIRCKLRRIKRLTVGYICNIPNYIDYRKYRHYITGPLHMARAAILLEDYHEQKAQREQEAQKFAAQFLPLYLMQAPMPEHSEVQVYPLPLYGGTSVQVDYPGQFAGYQPIIGRHVAEIDTRRIGPPQTHLQHLIEPEVLPQQVRVIEEDAQFLLGQPVLTQEEDLDPTEPRLRSVQEAG